MKQILESTYNANVLSNFGDFSGCFTISENTHFISSTDGVGTKCMLANNAEEYQTLGKDLVNHCINDIFVCGAKPLFFLNYFGYGNLSDHESIQLEITKGMASAAKVVDMPLISGETACMNGIYIDETFDLVGTIVGSSYWKPHVQEGDNLIGLPSNGIHTNGWTLFRSVLSSSEEFRNVIDLHDILVQEHRSYYDCNHVLEFIHGMAHVTGGGIEENLSRILGKSLRSKIDWDSWQTPEIFDLIQLYGDVSLQRMRKEYNLGIGMVFVVPQKNVDFILTELKDSVLMGVVVEKSK